VSLVERLEGLERKVADDIAVEHKEGRVILAKNIASKGQRTSWKWTMHNAKTKPIKMNP